MTARTKEFERIARLGDSAGIYKFTTGTFETIRASAHNWANRRDMRVKCRRTDRSGEIHLRFIDVDVWLNKLALEKHYSDIQEQRRAALRAQGVRV